MQFRLDGADLGAADTSAPYSASWNTTTAANGDAHAHGHRAGRGRQPTTATNVTVTVNNVRTPNGLVAAYGFEEASGANTVTRRARGNTGTISRGHAQRHAAGSAARSRFDGVNDWVTVPDANSLDLTTSMTRRGLGAVRPC